MLQDNLCTVEQCQDVFMDALWLPPEQKPSDWAKKNYSLPTGSAEKGLITFDRTPYQVEMMDAGVEDEVSHTWYYTSSQVGKTTALMLVMANRMITRPGGIIMMFPTKELGIEHAQGQLAELCRGALRSIMEKPDARFSTGLIKLFKGGFIKIVGANSPVGLASTVARYIFIDETDRCTLNAGGEGDPFDLLAVRQTTWRESAKSWFASTPTIATDSRIEAGWKNSDAREYHVPCLKCGTFQYLRFKNFEFFGKTQVFICIKCGKAIEETDKFEFLKQGLWVKTNPTPLKGHIGFRIWAAYSPWIGWADLREKWVAASKGPREKLQVFTNTMFGEPWADKADRIDETWVFDRLVNWTAPPSEIAFLTMAVDVQDKFLEYMIMGWGLGERGYGLKTAKLEGWVNGNEVWNELDKIRREFKIQTADGRVLNISLTVIDSRHQTNAVLGYCGPRLNHGVRAIYGGMSHAPIVSFKPNLSNPLAPRWEVGSSQAKSDIMARFQIPIDGARSLIFSKKDEDGFNLQSFLEGVSSEVRYTKQVRGHLTHEWTRKRDRNEALDLLAYNLAAQFLLRPDWVTIASHMRATKPRQRVALEDNTPAARPFTGLAKKQPQQRRPNQSLNQYRAGRGR